MSITKATNRADQINELHQGIQKKLRTSVTDAIEIGRLLTEQQSELSHGDFLPWLKSNIACGQTTAYKYIKLHDYRFKLSSSVNLNEAYKQVETIEAQENRKKQAETQAKVKAHREAGTRPVKDNSPIDREYRKQEADKGYEERKAQAFTEPDEPDIGISSEDIRQTISESKRIIEDQKRHEHLSLSTYADTANQAGMFTAIEQYINSFDDISRQLEATHNLIKKLKAIANGLQQRVVGV